MGWGSENCTKKVRLLDVVYNATGNELVRTKTLTKNTIVQIDAHAFKQWYLKKYGVELGKKGPKTAKGNDGKEAKDGKEAEGEEEPARDLQAEAPRGQAEAGPGRGGAVPERPPLGRHASRPGQCGRCDGYVLEGEELTFYKRKLG